MLKYKNTDWRHFKFKPQRSPLVVQFQLTEAELLHYDHLLFTTTDMNKPLTPWWGSGFSKTDSSPESEF